jgi:hypothetical protein
MRIRFLNGPKKGTTQNVPRDASTQLLIDAGLVEAVPTAGPDAGDPGVPLNGTQHVLPPCVTTVTWGIKPLPYSQDGKPTIVKQFYSEFTWYAAPPKECPKEIADRFAAAMKTWERTNSASADARALMEESMARQRNL